MSSPSAVRAPTPEQGTESATRVADVLLAVGSSAIPLGVTELSRRLGLSKAVVYRVLQSLESRDLIRFDERARAYTLGPSALTLGARALREHDLRDVAVPVLRRLQHLTGETTTVSALVGAQRVYLDQVVSHRELKMTVELGRPFPLYAGSSSKAILAFVSADLREHVLSQALEPLTPRTITDRAALEAELERVARTRLAVSRGERQHGAGSIASPVFGPGEEVVGSISVCGPLPRFDAAALRRYGPLLRRAAEEVSAALRRADAPGGGDRRG